MAWRATNAMLERERFIEAWLHHGLTMTGLCGQFGISRECGYKWIERFKQEGLPGLEERSRTPIHIANKTPQRTEQELLGKRKDHPTWGPKKLIALVRREHPGLELPAPSTVWAILKRNGLVEARRRRTPQVRQTHAIKVAKAPNEEWSADYKGQFRMKNGRYCYPLTIQDRYSRFFLRCDGAYAIAGQQAQKAFELAFREHGLPERLRTDNGSPFGGTGVCGLSRLCVWLIKLRIQPIKGRPAHPQDNGRLERLHRTLKQETARPPEQDLPRQQRRFNAFRREYNELRPHEAIGMKTPAELYQESPRSFPVRLESPEYPGHYEVRRVGTNGCIKWCERIVYVSNALIGEPIGLLEVETDLWRAYFGSLELGIIDEQHGSSHRRARRVSTMCPS